MAEGYEKRIFIYVTKKNRGKVIKDFCTDLFQTNLSEGRSKQGNEGIENELVKLLHCFPVPYTIVQEFHHIDPSFRDTYYKYFSNQHFYVKRYSKRLSFFKGRLYPKSFFEADEKKKRKLQELFMGACVINPLIKGAIGRTLIHPQFVIGDEKKPVYMRLSKFTLHIYGKKLVVNAFPYRMQDEETMRCAEVTLLNILDYYSNTYKDYRFVTPSEILESELRHNHERVLPSRGISYPILTKVLSEFGFSPRLYDTSSIDQYSLSRISQENELKRWLHYYIESGIPVAINLAPIENNESGHSVVCIGHGSSKKKLLQMAKKKKWISWENRQVCHPLINSADFFDEYAIVDDNQAVYQIRQFDNLSQYPNMKVKNIAVPLYKRMFLDAPDAATIARSILHDNEFYGIHLWCNKFLEHQEDVVVRLFMASSHSLKEFRCKSLFGEYAKEAYAIVPMPRFVWVCELYRVSDYDNLGAFGEIVIDATSAPSRSYRSLILVHYPGMIGVRYPEQTESIFDDVIEVDNDGLFPGFGKNLQKIK